MNLRIYAKDITNKTGMKERTVRKIIGQIRRKYNKSRVTSSP